MRFINTYMLIFTYFFIYYTQKAVGFSVNFDVNDLRIVTSDDGSSTNLQENDKTKYTVTKYTAGTEYRFKSDVKCVALKYKDQTFFQHDEAEHQGNYPTSFFLDGQDQDVTVHFGDDWYYNYSLHSGKYRIDSSKKRLTESQCPPEVQLFGSNSFDDSQSQMDFNQYKVVSYYKRDQPKQLFYYFEDSQCGKVVCDNQVVWKHDSNSGYPRSMTYMKNKIILPFEDSYLVFTKTSDQWVLSRSQSNSEDSQDSQDADDSEEQGETGTSLRGTQAKKDKETAAESGKPQTETSFPDTLADALVIVIMVSIIASLLVLLVLLLSIGLTFFIHKRAKNNSLLANNCYNY